MNIKPLRTLRESAWLHALALRSLRPLRLNLIALPRVPRCGTAARALTLIELLVVIVILVTLVAGVIPILSPDNDVRKIREAARGLHTYLVGAQAEAARTGRPQGVGFRENASGGGVALEAFRLEVPVPFAGFSEDSRVEVDLVTSAPTLYGTTGRFSPLYNGYRLFRIAFGTATGGVDPLPPRMFRVGDEIDVGGNRFLIVDESRNTPDPNNADFLDANAALICIWLNNTGQQPPQGEKPYKIIRQPTNSSASPYVLPAGVAIDLQGSVQEGGTTTGFPIPGSFATNNVPLDTVGIMFSPAGHVSSLIFNESEITSASRIMLLLGRVENGSPDPSDYDFGSITQQQLEDEKRGKVNWLNLDSRWIAIAARSGRITVSENAFVPHFSTEFDENGNGKLEVEEQIEAAHDIGHDMKQLGGR